MTRTAAFARNVFFLLLFCCTILAQQPQATPEAPAQHQPSATELHVPEPPHDLTAADVQAFLDGFMPMQLERENIAGAVVLVVKDGKVLTAKGYGYSDVEKKTPVSVDSTLFRPGSISKLFTWTAVMQLVEQGKLDLDKDVNTYLDFKIPATFPQPITLRNLMTHTPGFEEQIKDLINREGMPMASLHDNLVRHMPARIFPPGTTPAYSNYGAALAGYIVQRVSGRPFNEYIAENIFQPLGMAHSTFVQPLPDDLKPLMSRGYTKGSSKPKGFELIEQAPAGALTTSAADISHFMIAHLQDGRFENAQILRPETAQLMHSRQAGLVPELNAMCLGFYEESRNGQRIIGHGGDTVYFHSDLHLVPAAGLGFFVSYNSQGKGEISPRSALWRHFLDRYFPYQPQAIAAPATAKADARSVAGHYIPSRRSQTNFLRVTVALGEPQVSALPDGRIKIDAFKDFSGETKTWQEIGPLLYREENGQDLLAFRRDSNGRLQLVPNFPAVVYQRATLQGNSTVNQALIIFALCVMGLTLALWPVGAFVRRHYHHRMEITEATAQGRLWIRLVCALDIIFVAAFALVLSGFNPGDFTEKLDLRIHLVQIIGVLGAAGSVLVLMAFIRSWRDRNYWWFAKFWNFVILLACAAFLWFAIYWNLLNFNLNY